MRRQLRTVLLSGLLTALGGAHALAHPHVFVSVKSTVVYDAFGAPKAVRHDWTFDEMFSAFAIQGLDTNGDGQYSREELASLAEVNITSLKEFGYFTVAKAGGKDVHFNPPTNYFLDYAGTQLTLHFTLPIQSAPKTEGASLAIEVYDPTYFVAFEFAKEGPAALDGAPQGCRIDAQSPEGEGAAAGGQKLGEDFFSSLSAKSNFGAQFANRITVRCGAEALAYAVAAQNAAAAPPPAGTRPGATAMAPDAAEEAEAAGEIASRSVADRVEQAIRLADANPMKPLPRPAPPSTPPQPPGATAGQLGAFGVVRPDSGGPVARDGVLGWIATQQSAFYKGLSDTMRELRASGSGFGLLVWLSFLYGVLHAAGPGHGKAVIASYLFATGETLRRGVLISFASAAAQAITAVAIVGVFALVLGLTSRALGVAAWWLEAASYVLIAAVGLRLLLQTLSGLLRAIRGTASHGQLGHVCGPDCGHSHAPDPTTLAGPFDWRRALAAVLAVGLRPCTGALLVLVFAIAQGMIWAGVAATFAMALGTALTVSAIAVISVVAKQLALSLASRAPNGLGSVTLGGMQVLAGFVVMVFGLVLLLGLILNGTPASAG